MRGKRCTELRLLLLPAALLGAGAAAAQTAPSPLESGASAAIVVLDASSSMSGKFGGTVKIAAVKEDLGAALGRYAGRLSFGLVAFGHRKASNCADSEIVAKPGELTFAAKDKLFDKIKPKGQAPVAAALSDAAKAASPQAKLDIVLIADGGDTCDADLCSTAAALKEKAPALRIHAIGLSDKEDELKPLACVAAATGGTFVAAKDANDLKTGLATVLDAAAGAAPTPAQTSAVENGMAPEPTALPIGTAAAVPIDLDAQPQIETRALTGEEDLPPGTVATQPIDLSEAGQEEAASPSAEPPTANSETAVHKSTSTAPVVNRVQSVPITPPPPPTQTAQAPAAAPAPPPEPTAQISAATPAPSAAPPDEPSPPAKTAAAPPPQVQRPVPVTFKALISEQGPRLQAGLTWRVYASKPPAEGQGFKLLSTHREAMPTAALLPGEYLVNAAYGLSNLTKKIKVESGRSVEETFVLNTGGLKLAALLPSGE